MAEGEELGSNLLQVRPRSPANNYANGSICPGAACERHFPASHTIRLLDSLGYETSGFRSESWNEFAEAGEPKFDFVFTVAALPHAANKADSDRHLPIS
jgi:hypothetical protein